MDIKLGNVGVGLSQFVNHGLLTLGPHIKGFGLTDGELTVVCTRDLSAAERTELIDAFKALPEKQVEQKSRLNEVPISKVIEAVLSAIKEKGADKTTVSDVEAKLNGVSHGIRE